MAGALSKGDSSTVDEIAVADLPSGMFAAENGLLKFYSGGAVSAGQKVSPYVRNVRVVADKQAPGESYSIGDDVNINLATQAATKAAVGGDVVRGGVCAEASPSNAPTVDFRLGE